MELDGKRVLITGGSSGIGFATAQALLARGARVFVTGRRPDALADAVHRLGASGGEVHAVVADMATREGRALTLSAGLEKLGALDILVNNAGGVRASPLEAITEDEIHAMIEVDLVAPILLTRAALPALRASGDALIVDISSVGALVGMPFYAVYAAAKAGLAHFGEGLRRELMGEHVGVLTVYPSGTDTPMMSSSRAGPDLGFSLEPASAVADAIVSAIESDARDLVRGGEARTAMIDMNRKDPAALDQHFLTVKSKLAEAVRDHSAL